MKRFLAKIIFIILWPIIRIVVFVFFRFKIKAKINLKELEPPFIVVINHTSWLDSFLAGASFPFNSKVFPICYAAWQKLYYFPLFFPLLFLGSTFPVKRGIGLENTLKQPVKILKNGGVVGIFPEGKRRRFGRPRKGKRGAGYLALTTGVPVLPIKIEGVLGLKMSDFFSRRKITVNIGEPFTLPREMKYPKNLNEATDLIIKKMRLV